MAERYKYISYHGMWVNSFFWRTQDQQEIDYVEEQDGVFKAWEFKWNPQGRAWLSKTFSNAYPNTAFSVVTPENVEEFLLEASA
jgi:hypothetical protein